MKEICFVGFFECVRMDIYFAILMLMSLGNAYGFNLDTKFPILYNGPERSYFGYTVALHRNRWGPAALVGAPRANSTTIQDPVYEPGALFRCKITKNETAEACQEISLLRTGNAPRKKTPDSSYLDVEDKMWLGVSLDVQQNESQNDTVVCGHLWKNGVYRNNHMVNGVCYVIDTDFNEVSVRKLLPLTKKSQQVSFIFGVLDYNYAFGQAGMSAAFSEDGSNLILGAPGIQSWTGSIIDYNIFSERNDSFYSDFVVATPIYESHFHSYFGYSVSSGKFFESKLLHYAVGAPRDGEQYGKVYIVRREKDRLIVHQKTQGYQFGEYFGASVLGVNLNGDSYTDLLVGAPFNSLDSAGDEGKVYVYISNGNRLQRNAELTGESKIKARFGTSMANIGDINQDGFIDIAIGAPYEDGQGAVYIYHGSNFGLKSRYVQKIEASILRTKLSGFGIHISRGLDIDDNGYPDILIGSYASSNAVLLRSRPIIEVFPHLTSSPNKIHINMTCEVDGKNLTCVQTHACLRYTGQHAPTSSNFVYTILVKDENQRGFFVQDMQRTVMASKNLTLNINQTVCAEFKLMLNPNIKDIITPIQVQLSYKLSPEINSENIFDKTFPVCHPASVKIITANIPFLTGCQKEDECYPNLIVSHTLVEPPKIGVITIGEVPNVVIKITVENKGEPAFLSQLHIYIPPEMPIINLDMCETAGQENKPSVVCDLGNPLKNDTHGEVRIKLDATKIPSKTRYLEIIFKAVTVNKEVVPDDNIQILPLHFDAACDISVTGFSSHEIILYDGDQNVPPTVSHTYLIKNHGPNPLQTIHFLLLVPNVLLTYDGDKLILYFVGLETEKNKHSVIPSICHEASQGVINVQPPEQHQDEEIVEKNLTTQDEENTLESTPSSDNITETSDDLKMNFDEKSAFQAEKENKSSEINATTAKKIVISCQNENVRCVELRCSTLPLPSGTKFAEISVSFKFNFTVLDKYLGPWDAIEFVTTGSIMHTDYAVRNVFNHPTEAQVKTLLLHEVVPPSQVSTPLSL